MYGLLYLAEVVDIFPLLQQLCSPVFDAVFLALTRERAFDLSHPLSLSEVGTWPGKEWIPGRSVGNFAFPWRLRT